VNRSPGRDLNPRPLDYEAEVWGKAGKDLQGGSRGLFKGTISIHAWRDWGNPLTLSGTTVCKTADFLRTHAASCRQRPQVTQRCPSEHLRATRGQRRIWADKSTESLRSSVTQLVKQFSALIEPDVQKPATGSHTRYLFWHKYVLCVRISRFPIVLASRLFSAALIQLVRVQFMNHLITPSAPSSLLGPNILLSTLFSVTLDLWSSLSVRDSFTFIWMYVCNYGSNEISDRRWKDTKFCIHRQKHFWIWTGLLEIFGGFLQFLYPMLGWT